ncbi:MAG: hypothetical protein ACRD5F_10995 [Candidatus Acidiferrales bacterium]
MAMMNDLDLCTFTYADGRRCRAFKMPTRHVCLQHWKHDGQFNEDEAALNELAWSCNALDTPRGINKALRTLFRLYALGKVPPRKAALLAYMGSLLLCSVPKAERKAATSAHAKAEPQPVETPAVPPDETIEALRGLATVAPGSNGHSQ